MTNFNMTDRAEALAKVHEITAGYRVLWGVGNPVQEPHAQVCARYFTYEITLKPEGDGYMKPMQFFTVAIGGE